MKLNLLFILFYFTFLSDSYSQYFNNNYGRPNPVDEFCYGRAIEYKNHFASMIITINFDPYINYPAILEIAQNGDLIKYHYPTDTVTFHYYSAWEKQNENEIDIAGSEYDSANNGSFLFLKLNSELKVQSKYTYKIPRDIGDIAKLKKLPNGNYAFCGLIQNYDEIDKQFEEQQAVFYLLDSLGNEVWHIEFGDPVNNEKFFDFAWDEDYNFYILGQWAEPYFDADFQDLVVKINKDGKLEWDKKYGTLKQLNGGLSIKIEGNNKIILFSGYKDNDLFSNFGKFNFSIIDSLGIVSLKKEYGKYGGEIYDCLKDTTGNYICIGQTDEPDGKKNSGFIVKFTNTGDTLWTRYYPLYIEGKKNTQWFYGINSNSDNEFILSGITFKKFFQGFAPNAQAWVMKVDSLGYDHNTQFPTSINEPEVTQENNIITFYPNPTRGELFYRWKELVPIVKDRWVVYFYDLQGKLVYTHPMSIAGNSIMLNSLPPGVYPYVIKDSKNVFMTKGKVVVQRRH